MNIFDDISRRASAIQDEMVRLRRDFHRHPELGFREHRTAANVASYLKGLGLEVREGVGETGVVGLLKGNSPGGTVMLRSDMDALPVQERGSKPYRSENPGVMHACGHDGHMAILLGTASVLTSIAQRLRGQVKFVFQPAEEGLGGASRMIEDGVLDDPEVGAAFGLHLITALPCGTVGWGSGTLMAAMDYFVLRVKGRSGHSSMPQEGVDAILASARIVEDLQSLNRAGDGPAPCSLVNIGTIRGGDASNVIAEEVELTGTVRTLEPEVREAMPSSIRALVGKAVQSLGADFELDYHQGYPPVINDANLTGLMHRTAGDILGADRLFELPPLMASEDMAFYLQKVPGCFFFLGAGNPEKGLASPLHSSSFDFDESALATGATLLASLALAWLETQG